jgi:hypothetical protein
MDLVMHTGRSALARSCNSLVKLLKLKNTPEEIRNMCFADPYFFFALVDGSRRSPSSYCSLSYYTQFAYLFKPKTGQPIVARFRLVPCDDNYNQADEPGLLDSHEQVKPWVTKRRTAETRSAYYLRNEYIERLHQDEPIKYHIQIQFAGLQQATPWNPQAIWNETDSPWIDIISVKLTTFLPERALSRTYFNIVEKPKCLEFPQSACASDYYSYQKVWSDIYTMFEMKHISQREREMLIDPSSSQSDLTEIITYTVTVCAGALKDNGVPKVDLYITLVGTESRTTPVHLVKGIETEGRRRRPTGGRFSDTSPSDPNDQIEMFEIEAENVGQLVIIVVAVQHRQLTDDWYLRYVIVADAEGKRALRFPCHSVVMSDVVLRTGEVCLKHKEMHEVHRNERLFELCARRHIYAWASNLAAGVNAVTDGDVCNISLPCGQIKSQTVEQLPPTDRVQAVKYTGLRWEMDIKLIEYFRTLTFSTTTTGSKSRSAAWLNQSQLDRCFGSVDAGRRFSTMRQFSVLPTSSASNNDPKNKALARWKKVKIAIKFVNDAKLPDGSKGEMCRSVRSDIDFGRLFLAGPNPLMVRCCRRLPTNFPVTQDMVEQSLERSRRLTTEAENGYLYIADYAILSDIPTIHRDADHRYMVAPLILLYVRASGELVPIAIQLHQTPGADNPIWTPYDRAEIWILAKLWVRCADFQVHFAVSHLFKCHWVMEPFVMATMRKLPSAHPVYKLLKRHLRYFLSMNTMLRCSVMKKCCSVDKFTSLGVKGFKHLVHLYLQQFTFNELFPPRDFAQREVTDDRKLPNYFYRDDATRLWMAMLKYCREMLGVYYTEETDLKADDEIQAWIRAIHDNGFPHFNDQQRQGLPRTFNSLDELAEVVTMVMFTLTCGHSASHSDAMDLYGFMPDVPALMRQPPPTSRNVPVGREMFSSVLPDQNPDAYYGSLAFTMLVYEPDENVLATSTEFYFSETAALHIIEKFKMTLHQINVVIKARNAIKAYLYENLLPESIPLSAEPIPYVPRKLLKLALPLSLQATQDLVFGSLSASNVTMRCMPLPVGVKFARTLGGRSFLARRTGGFDALRSCTVENAGEDSFDEGPAHQGKLSRFNSVTEEGNSGKTLAQIHRSRLNSANI